MATTTTRPRPEHEAEALDDKFLIQIQKPHIAKLPTLFAHVGGKARQATWIASYIDQIPHKAYIEPCCGSAAVFFAKKPSKIEILNDKEQRYPLLFRAIRNNLDKVIDYCSRIEYSKTAFDESYYHLRGNPDNLPEWQLGCWALFQGSASFSGYADGHSFAWRLKGQTPAIAWQSKLSKLGPYCARLQTATMTIYDCIKFIKKFDKPGVLFYVDPPYFGAEFRYKVAKGFSHEKLRETLHEVRHAKIILSHYDSEPYCTLYRDWRKDTRASSQSCKGNSEHSVEMNKPVVEALWFNYSLENAPP
jgi:DNA adenine methylase